MAEFLRHQAGDIEFSIAMVDNDGDAIIAGQTVEINIQRLIDDYWWNGSSWVTGAEPSLITAPLVGSTGVYKYTLSGAANRDEVNYMLHIKTVGIIARNYYVDQQITVNEDTTASLQQLTDLIVSGSIKADLRAVNGNSNIEGMSFEYVLELAAAMANGRFKKDVPIEGQITIYKRDNLTPLTIVSVTTTERTRES